MLRFFATIVPAVLVALPTTADTQKEPAPAPGITASIESGLPFVESFESGSLANWVVNAGASGNALVQADTTLEGGYVPHTGSFVAFLGGSALGANVATLDLPLNLSSVDVVEIDFWWLTFGLEGAESIRVDVYDGTWHTDVDSLDSRPVFWTEHTITLARSDYNFANNVILRFRVNVNGDELSDAAYLDDVTVTGYASPDNLVVSPVADAMKIGFAGGPFAPITHTFTLHNKGASSLNFLASSAAPWLDVDPSGGILTAGDSIPVTVEVNAAANGFAAGEQHVVDVEFENQSTGYSETRTVTLSVLALVFGNSLDIDPGWTTEGDWAYGAPTGGGSFNGDPTSGHTGSNVYGYNLNGDYTNNMPPYSLTTTAINCTEYTGIYADYQRWLGVQRNEADLARFQVSNDGVNWTTFWGNPSDVAVNDSGWTREFIDISSIADNQPTVYLRWVMGPTSSSGTYAGWNIDDVALWGADISPTFSSLTELPGRTGAHIDVVTDTDTRLILNYGTAPSGPYPNTTNSLLANSTHTLDIYPLEPGQSYYYELIATSTRGVSSTIYGSFATQLPHTLPFSSDFEGVDFDGFDANYNTTNGSVALDTTIPFGLSPYSGAQSARFLGSGSTCDLVLDLSGSNAIELSFAWLAHGFNGANSLRVDLFDGTWHTDVWSADHSAGDWEAKTVVISASQYNMIDGFIVRFRGSCAVNEAVAAAYLDKVSVQDMSSADSLLVTPPVPPRMSGISGGPFAPTCLTYSLTNVGGANLNWSGSANKPWLDITPPAGTLAPGASVDVDVCPNAIANGLAAGHYMATTRFTNNNSGVSTDKALTLDALQAAASYNMDSDPGFTTTGDWAYGVPTGGGYANGDPTSGYTGANVYGYNLAGDYSNALPERPLKTGAIDCSGLKDVSLSFWRWLAIEKAVYDNAKVQVSNDNSTWHDVWKHIAGTMSPTAWTYVNYDISQWADGQATVYIRWIMGATDAIVTYPGWNIDDVVVGGFPTTDPADPSLPPTLIVGEPSRYYARPGQQVSYDLFYEGASAITLADVDITLLSTGTADADVFITGAGTQQRKVRLLNLTGDGWLGLNLDFGTAHDTFGNIANRIAETAWFYVDSTAPSIYISPPTLAITDSGPVTYNVIYSGADGVPLTIPDVLVNTTGTASGTVSVLGSGRYARKVRFNNTLGNGRLGFNLDANTAYDFAGNLAPAAGPSDTFRVDNTPPLNPVTTPPVASFSEPTRWTANSTHQVKYTIVYRDASSITLNMADVNLVTTGTATADVAVSGSGVLQRKITLYNLAGEGTIGFYLNAGTASNAFGSAPATPVGPIFTLDNTGPGVYVTAPSQRVTTTTPITYTVFYSGADAITLSPGDVVVQTTGSANVGLVQVTGAGRYQRKVKLNTLTGKGAVGISLNAGTAVDGAGNPAPGTLPSIVSQVLN